MTIPFRRDGRIRDRDRDGGGGGHQEEAQGAVPFRMPPRNIELEESVLGSLMIDRTIVDEVLALLRPEDFYLASHGDVFRAVVSLHARGEAVDPFIVEEELKRLGGSLLTAIELMELINANASPANAIYHAGVIREHASRRSLIDLGNLLVRDAYEHDKHSSQIVAETEHGLLDVVARNRRDNLRTAAEIVPTAIQAIHTRKGGEVTGIPTGLVDLDQYTGGFQPGDLIIVGGRPSSGKTALGLGFAEHVALNLKCRAMVASLEMPAEALMERILASRCRIHGDRLRVKATELSARELDLIAHHGQEIAQATLLIDDAPGQTITQARAAALRAKTKHGLDLYVFDYLQLAGSETRTNNRQEEIAAISRGLKALARELRVPVIALSQLNRAVENREDRRPRMADLRESGAIEQDADIVLLVHRPEYYDPNDQPGVAELIVAKNRNGSTGTVKTTFIRGQTRFENLALSGQRQAGPAPAIDPNMPF